MIKKDFIKAVLSYSSEIISSDEFENLISSDNDVIIKVGFDPTTCDLHLGHLVILLKLSQFQKFGYKVCIIIGDFTAMIGDPSGKTSVRNSLSRDQIILNYKTYMNQISKFLNPNLTSIYFNSSWYDFLGIDSFLILSSFNTVSRMLERSDFKNRFDNNCPIHINEFIYPFLQAYDSVFLNSNIEIGGLDQKFNFVLSREIQRKFFQHSQIILMMPLLIGLDGKNKMSKSLNNSINLNDDFYDIFCKVMSLPDFLMKDYFLYLGFFDFENYNIFIRKYDNPMDLKLILSFKIVSLIYNDNLANIAKCRFLDFFSKKVVPNDIDTIYFNIESDFILLSDILLRFNYISSISEFKRFLKFKSIKINEDVILDKSYILRVEQLYNIRIGKLKFFKLFLKKIKNILNNVLTI